MKCLSLLNVLFQRPGVSISLNIFNKKWQACYFYPPGNVVIRRLESRFWENRKDWLHSFMASSRNLCLDQHLLKLMWFIIGLMHRMLMFWSSWNNVAVLHISIMHIYIHVLSISIVVSSLALGQSHDHPSASETSLKHTVYPKKYAHGFVVLCFVVVMQSFIMNSHEVFIHIHQGCFAGTGAIVRLPPCQWSKPDGYGKISRCITTTKHSKAKTVCIFLGIYCMIKQVPWIYHKLVIKPQQSKAALSTWYFMGYAVSSFFWLSVRLIWDLSNHCSQMTA